MVARIVSQLSDGMGAVYEWALATALYWCIVCATTRKRTPYHKELKRLKKEKRHGRIVA